MAPSQLRCPLGEEGSDHRHREPVRRAVRTQFRQGHSFSPRETETRQMWKESAVSELGEEDRSPGGTRRHGARGQLRG